MEAQYDGDGAYSRSKNALLNFLFSISLLLVFFGATSDGGLRLQGQGINPNPTVSSQCLSETELGHAVSILRSALNGGEVDGATSKLERAARVSKSCRARVLHVLTTALAQPAVPNALGNDPQRYALWKHGAALLVEVRATEALDLLIENLAVTDGLSTSLSHYPSVGALIDLGEVAIPKLQVVLAKDQNRYRRQFAVFCIASIGGDSAKDVLTGVMPGETNECVRNFIRTSLMAFQNNVRPNHVTARDKGRWYSDFYCPAG